MRRAPGADGPAAPPATKGFGRRVPEPTPPAWPHGGVHASRLRAHLVVLRLEHTLGALGLFYAVVALVLPRGLVQVGLLLAAAVFSAGGVVVWFARRRRRTPERTRKKGRRAR